MQYQGRSSVVTGGGSANASQKKVSVPFFLFIFSSPLAANARGKRRNPHSGFASA